MLALLSPAKTLDYKRPFPPIDPTSPRFSEETDRLVRSAARLGAKKLSALMHISDALGTLNADRYRGFAAQEERPALYAFAGDVYLGFEARSLEAPAIDFAQGHVRILSGLYGLLRPLDAIRPYRLEMGTRWAPRHKSLYGFWGNRISDLLADDLAAEGSGVILNLASKEYWHAVETVPPKGARIITVDFRENGPNGLRFNSFAAKRARGMMARYLCEHRIADPEAMKGFDSDGYRFDGAEGDLWRFVRG
ncbi:YaaA family protein [Flavisphingomonas formosensis]|uniref:YaaA family protein n=1 Tax=Flavisphingomonas formosensis TaxID=861534 RepID=UPI0012F803CC|nr:YaaA family protein [Sphingomonas formosensis]